MTTAYVLLTEKKIHAYSTHATASRIYARALRMGVKCEWLMRELKPGNRYRKAPTYFEANARGFYQSCPCLTCNAA